MHAAKVVWISHSAAFRIIALEMSALITTPFAVIALMISSLCCFLMCHVPEENNAEVSRETGVSVVPEDTIRPERSEDTAQYHFGVRYLTGHFDPAAHPDFVEIDSIHADRTGLYLHRQTYAAFTEMYEAAMRDGIRLQIRSATRNFNTQKYIWERKWTGETMIENGKNAVTAYPDTVLRASMILKYSSMPGTSRHHWGTDIDLNAFENSWFESGPGLDIYNWLSTHAAYYGFCQPYSKKGPGRPYGYEEERWHWSYLPLSQILTEVAADSLSDERISGFQGSGVARELEIVERYVLGIDISCVGE